MVEYTTGDMVRTAKPASRSKVAKKPTTKKIRNKIKLQAETVSPLAPSLAPDNLVESSFQQAYSPVVVAGALRIIEFTLISVLGLGLYALYVLSDTPFHPSYMAGVMVTAGMAIIGFQAFNLYDVHAFRSFARQCGRLALAWTIVVGIALAAAFFIRPGTDFSRLWLVAWYGLTLAVLFNFRFGLFQLVRHWIRSGRLDRRTVIVGGGEAGETLIKALEGQTETDIRILGVFDDRNDKRAPNAVGALNKLGTVDDLVEFARKTRIDLVIFALPISAESRILQMLKKLWVLPVDIRLSAHMNRLRFRPRSYSYIGNVPMLDVFEKPIADWDVVVKWLFDRIVGGVLLLLFLPVLLAVAVAVRLDSKGPIFFCQRRYGFNNELIEVFKFRSMYVDQCDATAKKLVTRDDPRVTRVGRFIRKTSLDELPQLINVAIKGNLSLVGPRPHAVHAKAQDRLYDEVVDGYFARHRVKPGITGWAQVNGWRGETNTQEKIQGRVEHDLYYIENWSVLFDLYILAITPFSLLSHDDNAY